MNTTYQRYVSFGYVLASVIAYIIVGKIGELVWDLAGWSYPAWAMTPPELIGLFAAIAVFAMLRRTDVINVFMNEAALELSKVAWPTRKETVMSAGVIAVVISFCAVVMSFFDVVWGWCVDLLY